jgi:hypothetical protein
VFGNFGCEGMAMIRFGGVLGLLVVVILATDLVLWMFFIGEDAE